MDPFCFLCFLFLCCLVRSLRPYGHLLGGSLALCSLVCDVLLCFGQFPIWCPAGREPGSLLSCV